MNVSVLINIIFLLGCFILVFFYWYSINVKIKSYYRSYDYVLLTIVIGFFLSRFFGIILDFSEYTTNGFGIAPFMQSLKGHGVEISNTLPWSFLKLGDGNYFFSAFVFAPYVTHLLIRNFIEIKADWRQQCYLFVGFGMLNLIFINLYRIYKAKLQIVDLNIFTLEIIVAIVMLAILLILKFYIRNKINLIRYNKISIILLDSFAGLNIIYYSYKDILGNILAISAFALLFYVNYFLFIKDHFIQNDKKT